MDLLAAQLGEWRTSREAETAPAHKQWQSRGLSLFDQKSDTFPYHSLSKGLHGACQLLALHQASFTSHTVDKEIINSFSSLPLNSLTLSHLPSPALWHFILCNQFSLPSLIIFSLCYWMSFLLSFFALPFPLYLAPHTHCLLLCPLLFFPPLISAHP